MRVLIVDDRLSVRESLRNLLAREPDMEIAGEAAEGTAAVALVRALRPEVVLMDLRMPGMNGLEATRAIRTDWPAVRVIGLSIYLHCQKADQMLAAGAAAYVSKAAPVDVLLHAMRGGPAPDPGRTA